MPVQFKFRGEKAFRVALNVTTPCTLQRVKSAIYEQARINDQTTDLALDNATTGKALEPRALLVPDALVSVIVRRTPMQHRAPSTALALIDEPADLAVGGEEDDLAIDRMVEQHDLENEDVVPPSGDKGLQRYNRSYRLAIAGAHKQRMDYDLTGSDDEDSLVLAEAEPPPPEYTCHRCGTTGGKPESHWIWACPTNDDPNHMRKVRSAKGVPRHWLKKVESIEEGQKLSAGGVTFTIPGHSGHYIIDHKASNEERKLRLGDTVKEKIVTAYTAGARRVEESLKCPLCHQLFRQAVLAPCCGATFCSDCVIDRLSHSSIENGRCPGCDKELLAHQLVANTDIRKQVEQVSRASTAAAIQKEKVAGDRQKIDMTVSLKDRVNRPRKHVEDPGTLALTNGASGVALVAQGLDSSWQPLGFGGLLSPEQFAVWQRAAAVGPSAEAKRQFEDWQRRMRENSGASASVAPPSMESFEEMKRKMREENRAIA
eukprot:TRINITY_DN24702_c0_g3_i1.p1 TRINITY_DN24702_c0_g3~~TRINITY_DN24702_c0_g3_i1.p1  ORF type:complete len:486 (+),score=87.54 TRINITY_DN24702_c0_g3_i1:124-1581(+)